MSRGSQDGNQLNYRISQHSNISLRIICSSFCFFAFKHICFMVTSTYKNNLCQNPKYLLPCCLCLRIDPWKMIFCLQKMMSANTNDKRSKGMAVSSIYAPLDFTKTQANTLTSPSHNLTNRDNPNLRRQPFTPTRNLAAQSMIFPNSAEHSPKIVGFGKLESMAKLITSQTEEIPYNSSISENQPITINHRKKEGNPFSSQIFSKDTLASNTATHSNLSVENGRKRRESVGIASFNREGALQESLRYLQRVQPVVSPRVNFDKQRDCESTNSGSGNELLKTKNFDFLKKRKEQGDPSATQSIKVFQPAKHSEHMWPLSISPMEQKSPLMTKDPHIEPSSASKVQNRHHHKPAESISGSHIEFKKKKAFDNDFAQKFQPKAVESQTASTTITDVRQKISEDPVFLKNRPVKPQREFTINDFQLLDKLGKGAFGQVFAAQEKQLGFMCVIKKMSKKRIREAKVEEHIIREIKLQSYLNHSHCTSLYGYFHDQDYLYLILELLPDGSLQQVKKKRKLPEKETADIIRQVAEGLKFMHEQYIIHRDLKPQNLFMNNGYVKIGDFGCSIYHNETGLRNTIVGCLEYSSPQQLFKEGYTDKIDSWSIGILTYQLLFGKSPFESDIKNIVKNSEAKQQLSEIVFPAVTPVRECAKQFILNLLQNNPDLRMDMDQVLSHAFLQAK